MGLEKYAVCISNKDFIDLVVLKIYKVLSVNEMDRLLRIKDESGEDYLYPCEMFCLLNSNKLQHQLEQLTSD